MKVISIRTFRITFIVGLILTFFSLFLEWYYFQIFDLNNNLMVSWNYNIVFGWATPLSAGFPLNEVMKPKSSTLPFITNILFLSSIILSGYVVLFKDVSNAVEVKKYNKYAYINCFTLLMDFFYTIVVPLMYLIPYELYFPFFSIRNYDIGFIFLYMIGPGYIMQLISFPLIFPYSIFYYRTITTFRQEEHTPEKRVKKVIESVQEPLDLDKFIAEEELLQEFDQSPEADVSKIVTAFIEEERI